MTMYEVFTPEALREWAQGREGLLVPRSVEEIVHACTDDELHDALHLSIQVHEEAFYEVLDRIFTYAVQRLTT